MILGMKIAPPSVIYGFGTWIGTECTTSEPINQYVPWVGVFHPDGIVLRNVISEPRNLELLTKHWLNLTMWNLVKTYLLMVQNSQTTTWDGAKTL